MKPPVFDSGEGVIQKITRISELPNVIYDNVELDKDVIISQSERSRPQVEEINAGGDEEFDLSTVQHAGEAQNNLGTLEQHLSLMMAESQPECQEDNVDDDMDEDGHNESEEELINGEDFIQDDLELDNGLLQQYEHVMNFGQASLNVIQALKTHLKQEYSWYSKKEIEQMVYKFLNEYLAKL